MREVTNGNVEVSESVAALFQSYRSKNVGSHRVCVFVS